MALKPQKDAATQLVRAVSDATAVTQHGDLFAWRSIVQDSTFLFETQLILIQDSGNILELLILDIITAFMIHQYKPKH